MGSMNYLSKDTVALQARAPHDVLAEIAAVWRCDDAQMRALLGGISEDLWEGLKTASEGIPLSPDHRLRISLLFNIHEKLLVLAGPDETADWLTADNHGPLLSGRRPLDYLTACGSGGLMAFSSSLSRQMHGLVP